MTFKHAIVLALVATTSPLLAGEGVLASDGDAPIIVWKSQQALFEGLAMLRARATVAAIAPLVACAPTPGTRVTEAADAPGLDMRRIVVTSGVWSGCRGIVEQGYLQRH